MDHLKRPVGAGAGGQALVEGPMGKLHRTRVTAFRIETATGPKVLRGWRAAFHPRLVRAGVKSALTIGTVLLLVDHLIGLSPGNSGLAMTSQIVLSYVVPYGCATLAALSVCRIRNDRGPSSEDDLRYAPESR